MSKKTMAVLFGGCSSEHEVSCMSVLNVLDYLDKEKYNIVLVGITKAGEWLKVESVEDIASGKWRESQVKAILSPDRKAKALLVEEGNEWKQIRIDVVFPVLHGLYGEDGTVQGLLELAGIPYVGCGVVSSAATMDKWFTKRLVALTGIRQADYVILFSHNLEDTEAMAAKVEMKLSYPVFVKPCNAGSSQGVTKAEDRESLIEAVRLAAQHDRKILIEETIVGREIECAVLGGRVIDASGVGEILAAADFYDYDAKYNNEESRTVIDPDLPPEVVEEIRQDALKIFRTLDCYGLSRVDFFVRDNREVIFNEINTIPGFTSISMYPVLWENRGIGKQQLVDRLVELAFEREGR